MPTAIPKYYLSCYFDVSDISFALVPFDPTQETRFFNFPYAYSHEAFSNQISDADFNKAVIESILKANKVKLSEVEIIVGGLLNEPLLSLETKFSSKIVSLIPDIKDCYPFIINDFTVLTKDAVLSYEGVREKNKKNLDSDEFDEFANLSIYPQIVPVDIPSITVIDKGVSQKVAQLPLGYAAGDLITFSGSRFSRNSIFEYLDWALAIDLVRNSGIYQLMLDRKNVVPLFALLNKYKPDFILNEKDYLEPLGCLINSPGDTECLVSSDLGTGQFFEVKKDTLYIVPADPITKESLSIKSHSLGTQDRVVSGGRAGLIFKTVESGTSIYDNVKVFNDSVSQLSICTRQS